MKIIEEYCTTCDKRTNHVVKDDPCDSDLEIVTCTNCGLKHKHSIYMNCGYY